MGQSAFIPRNQWTEPAGEKTTTSTKTNKQTNKKTKEDQRGRRAHQLEPPAALPPGGTAIATGCGSPDPTHAFSV